MEFLDTEIEKLKELKRMKLYERISLKPQVGSYLFSNESLPSAIRLTDSIYIISSPAEIPERAIWLLTLDEILAATRELRISFSQVTDYIHRKRYADGREREGVYQLLIEALRSTPLQASQRNGKS